MADSFKTVVACTICVASCLIGMGLFCGGITTKFVGVELPTNETSYANVSSAAMMEAAVIIVSGTNLIKNMIASVDNSDFTKRFYYVCCIFACISLAISQVVCGIISMVVYKLWDWGLQLALQGGSMGIISIFINRNYKAGTAEEPTDEEKTDDVPASDKATTSLSSVKLQLPKTVDKVQGTISLPAKPSLTDTNSTTNVNVPIPLVQAIPIDDTEISMDPVK